MKMIKTFFLSSALLLPFSMTQGADEGGCSLDDLCAAIDLVTQEPLRPVQPQHLAVAHYNMGQKHYSMGLRYVNGEGVEKNSQQALKFFQLSADQGYAPAQCVIGAIYFTGAFGVLQNDEKAKSLLTQSLCGQPPLSAANREYAQRILTTIQGAVTITEPNMYNVSRQWLASKGAGVAHPFTYSLTSYLPKAGEKRPVFDQKKENFKPKKRKTTPNNWQDMGFASSVQCKYFLAIKEKFQGAAFTLSEVMDANIIVGKNGEKRATNTIKKTISALTKLEFLSKEEDTYKITEKGLNA